VTISFSRRNLLHGVNYKEAPILTRRIGPYKFNFIALKELKNSAGTHPVSYPMGTRGSFPGGKAAGA
jgi:hypothetical protein